MIKSKEFIGLTKANAEKLAARNGLRVRVTSEDGQFFIVTQDFVETRINFGITKGNVVSAKFG